MFRYTIPLLLCACATVRAEAPTCYTPCGIAASEGNCPELQAYETQVVRTLAREVRAWHEEKICNALKTYRLEIHHHDPVADVNCARHGWASTEGVNPCISGLTQFIQRVITIENTDWPHTALAHEIAHVADEAHTGRSGHCRWADPRLLNALHMLTGDVDPSGPEPECEKL